MRESNKLNSIFYNIMEELYLNSTPSVSFKKLMKEAKINHDGVKEIPFEDYTIDDEMMENIVQRHLNSNHLSKQDRTALKLRVYLGCSPMTRNLVKCD